MKRDKGPDSEDPKTEQRRMELGKTAGFRPKDPQICDLANSILDATGMKLGELVERAFKLGLMPAFQAWDEEHRQAEKQRQRVREQLRSRLGDQDGSSTAAKPSR